MTPHVCENCVLLFSFVVYSSALVGFVFGVVEGGITGVEPSLGDAVKFHC